MEHLGMDPVHDELQFCDTFHFLWHIVHISVGMCFSHNVSSLVQLYATTSKVTPHSIQKSTFFPYHVSCSLFLSCLILCARFDFFGIYVVMFLEILKTLIQVLLVFSVLIIAFGFAFFILLQSQVSILPHTPSSPHPLPILCTITSSLQYLAHSSFSVP